MPNPPHARTILGNTGWLVLAEALGRVLTFLAIVHMSRALGPTPLGMVMFGFALFGVVSLVAAGGVEVVATRRVARTPGDVGRLATHVLIVAWLWSVPALAIAAAAVALLGHPAPSALVASGIAASALLGPLAMRAVFFGRDQMRTVAMGSALGQLLWAAAVVLLVRSPEDVVRVPLLWAIAEGVRSGWMLVSARRYGALRPPRLRALRTWAAASLRPSVGRIARGSLYFMDTLLLGALVPLDEVGRYAVALRLPLFLVGLSALVHQAVFPTLSRLARDRAGTQALMAALGPAAISFGVAVALTLGARSAPILSLCFGEEFSAGGPWMAVLALRPLLAALGGLYRGVLWAAGDNGAEARCSVIGSVATLLLAAGGAALWGPMGCAGAMVLGEALLAGLYRLAARERVRLRRPAWSWLALQGLVIGALLFWGRTPAPSDPLHATVVAIALGGLGALLPMLPQLPALARVLREGRPLKGSADASRR